MDRRERLPFTAQSELLLAALTGWQAGLWTALPGIIQSYDAIKHTASIQPAIQAQVRRPDESRVWVNLPLLVDCPVYFPNGGGLTLTFPVSPGDECLVIFASRCIDSWWQSGGIRTQAELRMHDLSDGFALVGVRSQPRILPGGSSTSAAQLRTENGNSYVQVRQNGTIDLVTPGSVNVEAGGSVNIEAPTINLTGAVNVDGTISCNGNISQGSIVLGTHRHTGVDPGGGTSGGPTP